MNTVKLVRELLVIVTLSLALMLLVAAMADPQGFGNWLGEIDQGRFGHFECGEYYEYDYTEDL